MAEVGATTLKTASPRAAQDPAVAHTLSPGEAQDQEALRRFLAGERGALGELAERYELGLLGLASGLLGDRERAMEAVQETWVRVIKYGRTFRAGASVKTWIYRILINCCKDIKSRSARDRWVARPHSPWTARLAGSSNDPPAFDRSVELRRAVDALEPAQRLLVLLCYHQGLTHTHAAEVLDIPVGTLKSRLHATLGALRAELGKVARHG